MKSRHLAFSLVVLAGLLWTPAEADDARYRESEAKLAEVRERIQRLQTELRQQRAQRDQAVAALRMADESVARAAARVRSLEQRLQAAGQRVDSLRRQVAAEQRRAAAHRAQLARQLRAAYASGDGGALKLLLDTEDPARLGRLLTYHRYFDAAHRRALQTVVDELARLRELEQRLAAEVAALEALRADAVRAQQDVAAAREERRAVLAAAETRVAARGQELQQLRSDAEALESLMARLRDVLADVRHLAHDEQPFRAARGRLEWPLAGPLLTRFGDQRGIDSLRWTGVLIGGRPGEPVRAVARGHVVFADWLRGFGLLLIVDHGDGFMTLYGHNDSVFKENGDWVEPGEVIASVGASGGQRRSGLYFEVRSGGKPVDPLKWLRPTQKG